MPNPVEAGKKPSTKFVLAKEALQSSLIHRVSTLENRDPKATGKEFLNGFPDSEFAAMLDCYPPPFDEYKQRVDPFYRTLEGYISDIYGKRRDLRILRMSLLANRAQIQVGKAICFPMEEAEDVLSVPLLNYKEELYFAQTFHFDFTEAKTRILYWTLGQFGQEQPVNWKIFPLPSRILYALCGIVNVEADASRWSYEEGSYPLFLRDNIAETLIPQI